MIKTLAHFLFIKAFFREVPYRDVLRYFLACLLLAIMKLRLCGGGGGNGGECVTHATTIDRVKRSRLSFMKSKQVPIWLCFDVCALGLSQSLTLLSISLLACIGFRFVHSIPISRRRSKETQIN